MYTLRNKDSDLKAIVPNDFANKIMNQVDGRFEDRFGKPSYVIQGKYEWLMSPNGIYLVFLEEDFLYPEEEKE